MKLQKITLSNFRCFEKIELDLHPKLTVLVATNGGGKTTLLDAARIAVWPFVKAFDLGSQTGKAATIQINDVRLETKSQNNMESIVPTKVVAKGFLDGLGDITWEQTRERIKPGTNTLHNDEAKKLTRYAKKLQSQVIASDDSSNKSLPVIAYLGTGRLWYQGRYTAKVTDKELNKTIFSRLWSYRDCLTATSSYKQFENWYGWAYKSYLELQIERLEGGSNKVEYELFENTIKVIKQAVNNITKEVTGWKDLQYSSRNQQKLVMTHPVHGVLPLDMLSDGVRNIVVLVADIAFRCIKLNPHLKENAALKSKGIVMIDEVDMFLHPVWQQQIIGSLTRAFPLIQFIVTTHSPQVLSTVPKECIRVLGKNSATQPKAFSYGEPSNDVLQAIMEVDPQPPVPEKKLLEKLTALVEQGQHPSNETESLFEELTEKLHRHHPQLEKIARSIRRQEALK